MDDTFDDRGLLCKLNGEFSPREISAVWLVPLLQSGEERAFVTQSLSLILFPRQTYQSNLGLELELVPTLIDQD